MENFEEGQSKYGRIYKVAGPCKYTLISFITNLMFTYSGRWRANVRNQNVRARQNWMGQVGR